MSVAARVARAKERNPSAYCPARRCLWRTDGGYCPRHVSPVRGIADADVPADNVSMDTTTKGTEMTTPLDTLNEDGNGNARAASALRLYRFARFVQGLTTADATARIAGLFGITDGDAGRLVGIGLGQRDRMGS